MTARSHAQAQNRPAAARSGVLNGWPLVGWAALAVAGLVAATLAARGTDVEGLHAAVRATARSSLVLFLLAFSASSLRRVWRSEATAWLLRNRRQIGVSFAVSHAFHLAVIFGLAARETGFVAEREPLVLALGGLGYVFIAAMVATSFDRSAAWLGRRRWQRLHRIGGWYLWGIFAFDYVGAAFQKPAFVPVALLVVGVAVLRIAVGLRTRGSAAAPV